ncbi:MAG: transposase [Flavobacteriales bacterium Tduv]
MLRSTAQISFSELYMERSTRRSEFFKRLYTLIHWEMYGEKNKKNTSKRPGIKGHFAYSGISLFKMMLLIHWYDRSDVGTEELVKELLICMRFCDFRLENQIPDHTTLCKFRNEIVDKKSYELLLKKINKELEKHQAIVKTGVIVDAIITVSPLAPKGLLPM